MSKKREAHTERNRLRNKVAKRILELDTKKIEILREGIKGRIWGRDGKKEGGGEQEKSIKKVERKIVRGRIHK